MVFLSPWLWKSTVKSYINNKKSGGYTITSLDTLFRVTNISMNYMILFVFWSQSGKISSDILNQNKVYILVINWIKKSSITMSL